MNDDEIRQFLAEQRAILSDLVSAGPSDQSLAGPSDQILQIVGEILKNLSGALAVFRGSSACRRLMIHAPTDSDLWDLSKLRMETENLKNVITSFI